MMLLDSVLIADVAVAALAMLFFYAGCMKLRRPLEFRNSISMLPFLAPASASIISWVLPLAEVAIAFGLVIGIRLAGIAAVTLLLTFMGIAAYAVRRRLKVRCNCFGNHGEVLSVATIKRNGILLAAATLAVLRPQQFLGPFELLYGLVFIFYWLLGNQLRYQATVVNELRSIGALPRPKGAFSE